MLYRQADAYSDRTRLQQFMKNKSPRTKRTYAARRRNPISLRGSAKSSKKHAKPSKKMATPLPNMKIADFYRPLKKPVTLRLDADVIAWFKKDGRRYQTRINAALRKVMEKEMKG